jgi:hypothetical protein
MATASGFPINFNVNLGKIPHLNFDDITLQAGGGVLGGLKFLPDGIRTTWGVQFGLGLTGKIWFLGK